MSDPTSEDTWPNYLPLAKQDIHAIGVIGLNYCGLEQILRALFSGVTRLNVHQTAALFHRLANNIRKDVLRELLVKTTLPDDLRTLVDYFLTGFGICADNRHGVMHSSSGGVFALEGKHGLVLKRYSKAGNELMCFADRADLRRIADEMHEYIIFGAWVTSDVNGYADHINRGEDASSFRPSPSTSTYKPRPPTPLNWRSLPDPKASELPPEALTLLSPYRVHRK